MALFELEMKVRDYECDAQGVVNNANYQHYYEATRHELMHRLDISFFDLHRRGIDLMVSAVEIKYKRPLRGMERFVCSIDSVERKGARYIFHQSITSIDTQQICSTAAVDVVCLIDGRISRAEYMDEYFGHLLSH